MDQEDLEREQHIQQLEHVIEVVGKEKETIGLNEALLTISQALLSVLKQEETPSQRKRAR